MHYKLYWIAQIHELDVDNLSTYNEPMTCIFYTTLNTHKSCTIYETWAEYSNQSQYTKMMAMEQLNLTLLHHVLLLEAQYC